MARAPCWAPRLPPATMSLPDATVHQWASLSLSLHLWCTCGCAPTFPAPFTTSSWAYPFQMLLNVIHIILVSSEGHFVCVCKGTRDLQAPWCDSQMFQVSKAAAFGPGFEACDSFPDLDPALMVNLTDDLFLGDDFLDCGDNFLSSLGSSCTSSVPPEPLLELPPIGLTLKKSESLVNLINQHLGRCQIEQQPSTIRAWGTLRAPPPRLDIYGIPWIQILCYTASASDPLLLPMRFAWASTAGDKSVSILLALVPGTQWR